MTAMTSWSIPWNVIFYFVVWHLWLRRNAWSFSNSNTPLSSSIHRCIWAAKEFYFSSKYNNESLKPILPHWSPPPLNIIKINCDASFLYTTKEAGCAVVCRVSSGDCVEGLIWKGYLASSHDAELKAIELAMNLIKSREWSNTILCSNAKRVVDEINSSDCVSNAPSLLKKCRDLRMEIHMDMRFEKRDSNAVADVLAKDARCNLEFMNETCIWTLPPAICNDAFVRDLTLCSENSMVNLASDVPTKNACNATIN